MPTRLNRSIDGLRFEPHLCLLAALDAAGKATERTVRRRRLTAENAREVLVMQRNSVLALLLISAMGGVVLGAEPEQTVPSDSRVVFPGGEFSDPTLRLAPRKPRSEADLDRIDAAAHYAYGRLLLQRSDLPGALRGVERAWRYDSESVSLLNEIILIAAQQRHFEEAARYAVLAAERGSGDFAALRQLANYLAQNRDWKRALTLYEKSAEKIEGKEKNTDAFLLHWEMGRLYFLTQDYKKSAESLSLVHDALKHPEKYDLKDSLRQLLLGDAQSGHALLAESFLQAKRLGDALAMFEETQRLKPDEAMFLFQRARVAEKRPDHAKALEYLNKYFAIHSQVGGLEVYDLYARLIKTQNEDPKRAAEQIVARLEPLFQDDAKNTPLAYFLAEQYAKLKKYEKAEALYRHQVETAPTQQAYQGLIKVLHQSNQPAPLLDLLGRAVVRTIALDSLGSPIKALLADSEMLQQLVEAAQKQEEAKTLSPETALAAAYLALAHKQYEIADRFFQHALLGKQIAQEGLLFTWGVRQILADRATVAAAVLQQLIEGNPQAANLGDYYYYLAGALEMAEQTDKAVRAAEKAVTLDPASIKYRTRIAWVYYHARRTAAATQAYRKVLNQFDDDHATDGVRAAMRKTRLALSNLATKRNNMKAAVEWLEQVLDEFPEDIGATNDLSYLWAEQGLHLERAYRMAAFAVKAEPNNAAYLDSLGWALFQLQRYEEAVVELQKAVASDEPDGVILDHLGEALWQTKAYKEAQNAWRRAMKAFSEGDQAEQREKIALKIKRRPAAK